MSGLTAEAAGAFIYVPSDVVSQRLQVQNRIDFIPLHQRQTSATAISRAIWKTEGIKGFFRGYVPYLLVFGPGSAVWWGSYEIFKRQIHKGMSAFENCMSKTQANYPSSSATEASHHHHFFPNTGFGLFSIPYKKEINHFVSGALAGVCSVLVTNPLDVSRTRLQLLEYQNDKDKKALRQGFFSMLGEVYRREGIHGFYKGVKPRVFVSIPGSAIAFVGYEYLKEKSLVPKNDVMGL